MVAKLFWSSVWLVCLSLALSLSVPGCSHEREEALAEVDKIEQACLSGNPEQARRLMLKAVETNREFGRALADSGGDVADPSRVNACGLVLTRLRRNLRAR